MKLNTMDHKGSSLRSIYNTTHGGSRERRELVQVVVSCVSSRLAL